jgi:hypothetical protein
MRYQEQVLAREPAVDIDLADRIDELLKVGRKADEEDKKLIDNMQRLVRSHDFEMYCSQVLGPRIQSFGAALLEPSGSHDGMVRSEFMKGALYGLCLARDLPSVIISATQRQELSDE